MPAATLANAPCGDVGARGLSLGVVLVIVKPGWVEVRAAAAAASAELGDHLASAYAIGSLAHGGFNPAVSDVDVGILTTRAVEPAAISRIAQITAAKVGSALSQRLSIFHVPWSEFAAPPMGSRFPAIDRLDLKRHGVLIAGDDLRAVTPEPPEAEVIAEALDFGLPRLGPESVRAAMRNTAFGDLNVRETTKLILFPVRLLFVACTALVGSNDDAVLHYHEATGQSRLALVDAALAWRRAGRVLNPSIAESLVLEQLLALHQQVLVLLGEVPELPRHKAIATLASICGSWSQVR